MDQMDFTPQLLFDRLRKTIIGQDDYLKALSSAAWLHSLRYQHYLDTGDLIDKPKNNILVIGNSGTGKTLAVQKLGELLSLPVVMEDASALTGSGWHGRSVSDICESVYQAADRQEDRMFSIICLDEIDKVFRANSCSQTDVPKSSFLPISNLLTLIAGGTITSTDSSRKCSIDSSNFLIICLGAFEGLDEIIRKRMTGNRQIGFVRPDEGHEELETDNILQYATEADLNEYGIPVEFLGRLNTITWTITLNAADYKQILTQSDASPVKQFNRLLSDTSHIRVSITDAAIEHIAAKASETKEGARMLARIVSETLQPAVFSIGGTPDLAGIEIECGKDGLYTRSVYDVYQGWQDRTDDCPFDDGVNEYLLHCVPMPCGYNRGDILIFADKVKRSSKRARTLPEKHVSAATCVIAAAICSQLAYARWDDKDMLTLYNQIDCLPDEKIPYPSGFLENMINEFILKSQKDVSFAAAKNHAKHFIADYCNTFSVASKTFSS